MCIRDRYRGIADCVMQTARAEGAAGLYAGMGPTLAGIVPYAGINFCAYDLLKREAQRRSGEQLVDTPTKLLIGAVSGMVSQTASYPIDTVRRRMQLQGTKERLYSNSLDCLNLSLIHI
eukprot:TRINITY_DN11360_c0_g1_i1.p1 TRINITY_DN11360_c0_g1~~TRINITY_DN11360_c0_g1_i1.p1  ORF type:complete len:119 (+),score=34.28 TRINITY_DN11360_c0_g1_i1:93-449(+)